MASLKGKVIWLTGASSGIGEALVYALAKENVKLILSARRTEELERVKGNCPSHLQADIRILPLDLAQASTLSLTVEAAIQLFGHVDILINNGGISQRSLAKDTSLDVDRRIMEVDYFGAIALTKGLLPHFLHRKSGHFVTISSVMGKFGAPYRTGYAAAKHALHGFFDALRAELWKDCPDIYVTLITPGWIQTNLTLNAVTGDGSQHNKMGPSTASGLSPEDFSMQLIQVINKRKNEAYIGRSKEKLAIYIKRFFPGLLAKIVRKAKTT